MSLIFTVIALSWWVSAVMAPSAAQHQHCPPITTITLNVTLLWTYGSNIVSLWQRDAITYCVWIQCPVCVCVCRLVYSYFINMWEKRCAIKKKKKTNKKSRLITNQGYIRKLTPTVLHWFASYLFVIFCVVLKKYSYVIWYHIVVILLGSVVSTQVYISHSNSMVVCKSSWWICLTKPCFFFSLVSLPLPSPVGKGLERRLMTFDSVCQEHAIIRGSQVFHTGFHHL